MILLKRAAKASVIVSLACCAMLSADGGAIGTVRVPQFRVNSADTLEDTIGSSIASDRNGALTVVWIRQFDDSTSAVLGRQFNSGGQASAGEVTLNSLTGYYAGTAVAMNRGTGDFVVTWTGSPNYGQSNVYVRLYDHTGAPKGPEFVIDDGSEFALQTYVAMNASGQFVVGWNTQPAQQQQYPIHAYLARFDAQGAQLSPTQSVGFQSPQGFGLTGVGVADDGHTSASWFTQRADGYQDDYVNCFDAQGQPLGGNSLVASTVQNNRIYGTPTLAQAADGTIGVAYWGTIATIPGSNGNAGAGYVDSIYAQVLNSSCAVLTGEFPAIPEVPYNGNSIPQQFGYSIAADSVGQQLAVAWGVETTTRNPTFQPYARLLSFSGAALSDPVTVGTSSDWTISQAYGSIDGLGNLWLGWTATVDYTTFNDVFAASVQGAPTPQAAVTIAPHSQDFGSVTVGSSASFNVTVTSNGGAPLSAVSPSVTGDNAADFNVTASTCAPPLPAGQSCTLTVMFKPSAIGARTATLQIATNAPTSPDSVALSGNGIATVGSITPSSLDFGMQLVQTSSTGNKAATIRNTGNAVLHLDTPVIGGTNAADFSISSNGCGTALQPGDSCVIFVGFKPSGAGTRTATLSISWDAANSPGQVSLSGVGTAPAASVSPASLAFGTQQNNTTSTAKSVTVSNSGTAALHVGNLTVSGTNAPDFSIASNGCVAAVQPGQSCTVAVTFRPSASGARNATLNVPSDAANGQQAVSLGGTGSTLCLPLVNVCLPL